MRLDSRSNAEQLLGKRFGRITVRSISKRRKNNRISVSCLCDCGNKFVLEAYRLLRENCKQLSCGCGQHDVGLPSTYHSWKSMRERCMNKKAEAYARYGGRGITVDERWLGRDGYKNFVKDMGPRPEGKSLDREDNDGNYTKKNCRWATSKEQANNRRNSSARHVRRLLESLDLNLKDENLLETPLRVAKSLREDLLKGYKIHPSDVLTTSFSAPSKEMVILKDIEFYSTCSHHLMPFVGRAHVAYIPNRSVVGLSKLARLVECFSRRLQLQEALTSQVADALQKYIKPLGSAVVIEAKHFCVCSRGVGKQNAYMITSAMRGAFMKEPAARAEFMALIGGHNEK